MSILMRVALLCWNGLFCSLLWAQDAAEIERRLQSVTTETGLVRLEKASARIEIPQGWRYLSIENLARALQVSTPTDRLSELGWLVPEGMDLSSEGAWGVQLYLNNDGAVEEDVNDMDPYHLVWRTRDAYKVANWGSGFFKDQAFEFVNFARAPQFDAATDMLHWTERIRYPDDDRSVYLDVYSVAFYRRGAVVAFADYIPEDWQDSVESAMQSLIGSIKFDVGERYDDIGPADPRAEYTMSHFVSGELWFDAATDSWSDWFWKPVRMPRSWSQGNAMLRKIKVPQGPLIVGALIVAVVAVRRWILGAKAPTRVGTSKRGARR